ncbi:MAG: hypothetical protein ACE5HD_10650 [Acidobacteriota bacterium]
MLARTGCEDQRESPDLSQTALIHLTHSHVLSSLRQVNGRLTRELMNSPDTLRLVDLEDAPVPINLRRFCQLMAPYLCMN